jgi:hypothetical protein
MLHPLEPSMDSPRCHLTVFHRQLTSPTRISPIPYFSRQCHSTTCPTITTTTFPSPPPPGDNPNLHALSLIDILYFPSNAQSPPPLSNHTTSHPPLSLHALGLGVFPTPSRSFLPFGRPLSPSRSSMLPRSPLLPNGSRRTAHFPTRMASYLP